MTIQDILKDSNYKLTQFSQAQINALQSRIVIKGEGNKKQTAMNYINVHTSSTSV